MATNKKTNMSKAARKTGNKRIIEHIVKRYAAGDSAQVIADDLGYSRQYITKVVKKYGEPRGRGRRRKLKLSIDEIIRRSAEGEPATTIAKDAGCSPNNIRKIVKDRPKSPIERPTFNEDFDKITRYLTRALKNEDPKQFEKFEESMDLEFLGYVDAYFYMSKITPIDRVIYDIGCGWGFQSFFFKDHKKYIGIDEFVKNDRQWQQPNAEYHHCSVKDFLEKNSISKTHFAICNFIPSFDVDNGKLVRENFKDVYVYYP